LNRNAICTGLVAGSWGKFSDFLGIFRPASQLASDLAGQKLYLPADHRSGPSPLLHSLGHPNRALPLSGPQFPHVSSKEVTLGRAHSPF
jgi:hypothetical protein